MKKEHQEWLDLFLQNCRDSNKSAHTLENYHCDLQKYIGWYERHHRKLLNEAQANTISQYKAYLAGEEEIERTNRNHSKGRFLQNLSFWVERLLPKRAEKRPASPPEAKLSLAVASRKRHLSAIKNFYEYLKQSNEDQNRLFKTNPVRPKLHNIKLKEEDVEPTQLLTADDWKAIQKSVYRPREKLIVHLLYWGGLRLAELSNLRVENFDFEQRTLRFVRKGGFVHTLPLQQWDKIALYLNDYLHARKETGPFLFAGRLGRPITTRAMTKIIMKIFLQAGTLTRGLTPHSFRKACATNLYEKSKDLLYVRDYLNHSDAKVTQTYIARFDVGTRSRHHQPRSENQEH